MDRVREGGFSLMEVGLALSIGILLTGASVYGYKALRAQSGDSAMRQKVQDLQILVEELYAPTSTFPSATLIRQAWKQRRPNDYNSSPWGGTIVSPAGYDGLGVADIPDGSQLAKTDDSTIPGGLYYYTISTPAGQPGSAQFEDLSRGTYVPAQAYMVAGNKATGQTGMRFFHVVSGR